MSMQMLSTMHFDAGAVKSSGHRSVSDGRPRTRGFASLGDMTSREQHETTHEVVGVELRRAADLEPEASDAGPNLEDRPPPQLELRVMVRRPMAMTAMTDGDDDDDDGDGDGQWRRR